MKYVFTPYRDSVDDSELLSDLKRVAALLDTNTIIQREYIQYGNYRIETVLYRFGNWNNALEQANLSLSSNHQHSIEDLFENIERVWQIKGKQPVRSDMNNKSISKISSGAYVRRFGTWNNALKSFVDYMNQEEQSEERVIPLSVGEKRYGKQATRDINLRLRWRILQRDNFKCCKCGASPATDPSVILHIDHIIPMAKGGETTPNNLQTLCSKCNLGKSDLL